MLYPKIAQELLDMEYVDQEMRSRNLENPDYWDVNVDHNHTNRMKEIVGQIGWPTVSKVGDSGAHSAWLLVQHADHDVNFQRRCLKLMKKSSTSEISQVDLAYLEDRVRVNLGEPQLFGTQFSFNEFDRRFIPKPIKDPEKVEERRSLTGLGTMQDGITHMYEKYRSKT